MKFGLVSRKSGEWCLSVDQVSCRQNLNELDFVKAGLRFQCGVAYFFELLLQNDYYTM